MLFDAAVRGVAPSPATERSILPAALDRSRRVWLFAFGKGAHAMAAGAVSTLHRGLQQVVGGLIVAPEMAPPPCATVEVRVGDHPVPGRQSFAAAQRLGEIVAGKRADDLAVVLISGGASSLLGAPLRGMSERDISSLYELLLGSGLDVRAMNSVRKRFTRWGAGRLSLALAPAGVHCLIMSDVIGDQVADVGSGPCVPDALRASDIVTLLTDHRLWDRLPQAYRDHLAQSQRGSMPETPKATHPAFAHVVSRVIASNRIALAAAAEHAKHLGLAHAQLVESPFSGDASATGALLARELVERRARSAGGTCCSVRGGETTVRLPDASPARGARDSRPPMGGRCTELALSAARELSNAGDAADNVALLACGTDGRDGSSDAAGAIVTRHTWSRIIERGLDPDRMLRQHESHAALDAAGALVRTGATGTNVADVVIGVWR